MIKLDWYRLVLHLGMLNVRFCLSDLIVSFIGGNYITARVNYDLGLLKFP